MRRFQLSIQRTELLTISESVGEWEIPILQLVHGAAAVAIGGFTTDSAPYPAAAAEYERLERRYRENPATGATRVSEVYGPAPGGVRMLFQAIKDAATEQNTPESFGGGETAISDELTQEIAAPGTEAPVVDLGELTGDAPPAVDPPKPAAKPATKAKTASAKAPSKQLIPKSAPQKAAVVPTPKQPTDPIGATDPTA